MNNPSSRPDPSTRQDSSTSHDSEVSPSVSSSASQADSSRPDVQAAASRPERLAALARTGLLDTPPEENFDRLTRLVARIMNTPLALVNLIDEDRQFTKSCVVPEGMAPVSESRFNDSFCQYPVALARPLIIEDARNHAWVSQSAFVRDGGIIAYLGVPLHGPDDELLGSLCVADSKPRAWTEDDVTLLEELTATVETEISLRVELRERAARERLAMEGLPAGPDAG